MAKKTKSTKKSKGVNKLVFYGITLLLGVLAIAMIFANVCGIQNGDDVAYQLTGIQATFGFSETTKLLGTVVYTNFSILNLLLYIALLAGVVLLVLKLVKVLKSNVIDYVIAALFVVAGIMYFIIPTFVVYGDAWSSLVNLAIKAGGTKVVMAGGIVGGIASILAGATLVVGKFVAKK